MAGRKQHYIPQFLLKGFGAAGAGKAVNVTIYSAKRVVFTTATQGAAAPRDFYSGPPDESGIKTLDDQITAYEHWVAPLVEQLRASSVPAKVPSRKMAEMLTHFCVRTAYLRHSGGAAMETVVTGVAAKIMNPPALRKFFKLDDPMPSRAFRDMVRECYEEERAIFARKGISPKQFETIVLSWARKNFNQTMEQHMPVFQMLFERLHEKAEQSAQKGHVRALEQSLAPEARVESLARLDWTVERGVSGGHVLPDCIAVAWIKNGDYVPLLCAELDEILVVIMPLNNELLLVGRGGNGDFHLPLGLNRIFAECCWDYFVCREESTDLAALVPALGSRTARWLIETAGKAAAEL